MPGFGPRRGIRDSELFWSEWSEEVVWSKEPISAVELDADMVVGSTLCEKVNSVGVDIVVAWKMV